jgi:DNA (cytosine-5)-methyltransferase 1
VGENVRGLTNWNGGVVFDEVCSDLEALGYKVAPYLIPASAANAPHKRERIWFIAYAQGWGRGKQPQENSGGQDRRSDNYGEIFNASDSYSSSSQCRDSQTTQEREKQSRRIESFSQHTSWEVFPTQSPICGGDDGLPTKLDGITFPKWRTESIKAYGNAVVPNLVFEIFKTIEQYELLHNA